MEIRMMQTVPRIARRPRLGVCLAALALLSWSSLALAQAPAGSGAPAAPAAQPAAAKPAGAAKPAEAKAPKAGATTKKAGTETAKGPDAATKKGAHDAY